MTKVTMAIALLILASPVEARGPDDHILDDRPCISKLDRPGIMKSGLCVDNTQQGSTPAKVGCIYGQAGCVLGRRDVERILRERGEWPPKK